MGKADESAENGIWEGEEVRALEINRGSIADISDFTLGFCWENEGSDKTV